MADYEKALWVLDLDRTLVNTELIADRLAQEARAAGMISLSDFRSAKERSAQDRRSFDAMGHLRSRGASEDELRSLGDAFVVNNRDVDFLYPDGLRLMQALNRYGDPDKPKIPRVILTKGYPLWQIPKLQAARLIDVPYIITEEEEKGPIHGTWLKAGRYEVVADRGQRVSGDSIVAVDDAPASLRGMQPGSMAFLLESMDEQRRPGGKIVSNPEMPGVVRVPDLDTVAKLAGLCLPEFV